MKGFELSIDRIVIGLAVLLTVCWCLGELAQKRRENRERARYGGQTIHEWVELAMKNESYWSAHWVTLNPLEYANSEYEQKVIAMGAPAVPELVERLRDLYTGAVHDQLIFWRVKYLPNWETYPKFLEIQYDVSSDVALVNYLLSQMGEAARPAVPAMLDSARNLHAWAYYDLLDDFVRMGPVAHGALPELKRWAKAGGTDAARAVKYLELGKTKLELDDEEDNQSPAPGQARK
jgi:hypothetical protein